MWEYKNKQAARFLARQALALLLLACPVCGMVTFAEDAGTGAGAVDAAASGGVLSFVGPDEYLAIPAGESELKLYDRDGQFCGDRFEYIAEHYGPALIPKTVLEQAPTSLLEVYNTEKEEIIFSASKDDCVLVTEDSFFIVYDKKTGRISVRSSDAEEIGSLGLDSFPQNPGTCSPDDAANSKCVMDIRRPGDCMLIGYYFYKDDDQSMRKYCPGVLQVTNNESGEPTATLLPSEFLGQAFACAALRDAGSRLLLSLERMSNDSFAGSYPANGYLLLDASGNPTGQYFDDYRSGWNMDLEQEIALIRRENGQIVIYDQELNPIGFKPDQNPDQPLQEEYRSQYMYGAWYPSLGGLFEKYEPVTLSSGIPFARSGNTWSRNRNGMILSTVLADGEEPIDLNLAFAVVRPAPDGSNEGYYYKLELRWRETGEPVLPPGDTADGFHFWLGDDYCIFQQRSGDDTSMGIIDMTGTIRYRSGPARIQVWKPGLIFMERGIYSGITDLDGNWIIRTIRKSE